MRNPESPLESSPDPLLRGIAEYMDRMDAASAHHAGHYTLDPQFSKKCDSAEVIQRLETILLRKRKDDGAPQEEEHKYSQPLPETFGFSTDTIRLDGNAAGNLENIQRDAKITREQIAAALALVSEKIQQYSLPVWAYKLVGASAGAELDSLIALQQEGLALLKKTSDQERKALIATYGHALRLTPDMNTAQITAQLASFIEEAMALKRRMIAIGATPEPDPLAQKPKLTVEELPKL